MTSLVDAGIGLWMGVRRHGLWHLVDGRWSKASTFPRGVFCIMSDAKGSIWFGLQSNVLIHLDNGRSTTYGAKDGLDVGDVSFVSDGAQRVVAGEHGLQVLVGSRFRHMTAAEPAQLRGIAGMLVTLKGDHWFNGSQGIVHVRASAWARALRDPDGMLDFELFSLLDGFARNADLSHRPPHA